MRTAIRALFVGCVLLFGALSHAPAQGAPSIMVPWGKVSSDAISSDGTDPKTWNPRQDRPIAATANHKISYEDDDVRVLLVTVRPDEREKPHNHR